MCGHEDDGKLRAEPSQVLLKLNAADARQSQKVEGCGMSPKAAVRRSSCTVPDAKARLRDAEAFLEAPGLGIGIRVHGQRLSGRGIDGLGELRLELKKRSDLDAIQVFRDNLHHLLLAPPAGPISVLGIDPGQRTGCKVAVVDETGKFLANDVLYLHFKGMQILNLNHELQKMKSDGNFMYLRVFNNREFGRIYWTEVTLARVKWNSQD